MRLELIGINHQTSTVDIRDRAAMGQDDIQINLNNLVEMENIDGAVILSTCNRTELYVSPLQHHSENAFRSLFQSLTRLTRPEVDSAYIYRDEKAVGHLLRVSSGLNSQMIGEIQILKQVKDAYHLALNNHSTNSILNRMFLKAIECGKNVRHRTRISEGSVSVASAAIELSNRVFGSLDNCNVLLVGAGETVRLAAKFFGNAGVESWRVSNRTKSNAASLSDNLGGNVVEFPPTEIDVGWADIILSATSCSSPVVQEKTVFNSSESSNKMQLFLDLAIPRDMEPGIKDLPNNFLYTVDDFKDLVAANIESRQGEAIRAEKIVDKLIIDFSKWYQENRISPTIQQLQSVLETIRIEEVNKNVGRFQVEDRDQVDKFSKSLMRKVTSLIIGNLKRASREKDDVKLAKALTIALSSADNTNVNEVLEQLDNEFSHRSTP